MFKNKTLMLALALIILGILVGTAQAAQPAVFLNGQQLSIIIGFILTAGKKPSMQIIRRAVYVNRRINEVIKWRLF